MCVCVCVCVWCVCVLCEIYVSVILFCIHLWCFALIKIKMWGKKCEEIWTAKVKTGECGSLYFFTLMIDKAVLFIRSFIHSLLRCVFHSRSSQDSSPSLREESNRRFSPRLDHREDIKQSCSCSTLSQTHTSQLSKDFHQIYDFILFGLWWFLANTECSSTREAPKKDTQVKMVVYRRNNKTSFNTSVISTLPWATETQTRNSEDKSLKK